MRDNHTEDFFNGAFIGGALTISILLTKLLCSKESIFLQMGMMIAYLIAGFGIMYIVSSAGAGISALYKKCGTKGKIIICILAAILFFAAGIIFVNNL